jgi:hypothetical protein
MLKTTRDNPARFGVFSKALIVYAVLREYVHHPLVFLMGTVLTAGRFQKSIPKDIPEDFVKLFAFPTWIYLRLKKRMGQEEALAVARAIIVPLGVAVYGAEFRLVEAPRTWDNFIDFLQLSNREGAIRWSKVEMDEEGGAIYKYRCTFCMIHDFLSKVGAPELTEAFCTLDNALYNAYLPNEMIFHRGAKSETIEKGHPFCQFVHERKI